MPCGHFALGTLLEACLKDDIVVFEINVTTHFHKKNGGSIWF